MIMTYGKGTLQEFLHVDNLVEGHILAGLALSKDKNCIAVSIVKDYSAVSIENCIAVSIEKTVLL